jgi:hypothetical protein
MIAIMRHITKIAITSKAEIHSGANTHNHDHVITPQSFKTINTIVSKPVNPIPPVLPLE